MTRIKNTDYLTKRLLTKLMLYSCVMVLKSKMALKFFKPVILALTSVFLISACGGASDAGVETTSTPTPAPTPAPTPTPVPTPVPTPTVNVAPIANAGADQSVNTQTTVILSGIGTDIDGNVTSYAWVQIAGASITLANAESPTASFDTPTSTTEVALTFQLTVTDDDGASATDIVDIAVNSLSALPLTVTANNDNNDLVVSWNDVRADLYRVLFWDNEGNVYGPTTTSLSLSITATMRELGGSLVVEAYDALGNSVFSAPINVESL
jgi:hypothetical protein